MLAQEGFYRLFKISTGLDKSFFGLEFSGVVAECANRAILLLVPQVVGLYPRSRVERCS